MKLGTIYWSIVIFIQIIVIFRVVVRNIKTSLSNKVAEKYFTDTPNNLPPFIVSFITGANVTFADSFSSEVALFINKGILSAYKNGNKLFLNINRKPDRSDELWSYQLAIFSKILLPFADSNGVICFDDVSKSHNKTITKAVLDISIDCFFTLQKQGLLEFKGGKTAKDLVIANTILSILMWIIVCLYSTQFLVSPLMLVSCILVVFGYKIAKENQSEMLSKKGNALRIEWLEFRKFLDNYGRFEDRGVTDIIIWKKFLVYANLFSLSHKLKNEVDDSYTDEICDSIKKSLKEAGIKAFRRSVSSLIK